MVFDIPKIKSNRAFFNRAEFHQKNQDKDQKYVIDLINDWLDGKQQFEFTTSGSTGTPKKLFISRQLLAYSAQQTLHYLNIQNGGNMLLCIPPHFIGGQMVIVRAIINAMTLHVIKPMLSLSDIGIHFRLASMVPAQIESILKNDPELFNQFDNILIGGAPLSIQIEKILQSLKTKCQFHITYGMTETASHIALRNPGELNYKLIGDITMKTNESDCLMIKGTVTNNEWLVTNDIVSIKDNQTFEWLGRADFVINSGGIKINPEVVELKLSFQLKEKDYFITSLPHEIFGEQVVLVIQGAPFDLPASLFGDLSKYEKPKQVLWISKFNYTKSGKLDRIMTRELIFQNK